jgi:hypothetical protein
VKRGVQLPRVRQCGVALADPLAAPLASLAGTIVGVLSLASVYWVINGTNEWPAAATA